MAHPYHHAVSSSRQFGGVPEDYQAIHDWFDETKAMVPDMRHRAARHHAEGIFVCEQVFGTTITLSTCAKCGNGPMHDFHMVTGADPDIEPHVFMGKRIPVRWVAEQHVQEDMGMIPTLQDWLRELPLKPWMTRSRKLSRELEQEVVPATAN
jgi:hypothetical protein